MEKSKHTNDNTRRRRLDKSRNEFNNGFWIDTSKLAKHERKGNKTKKDKDSPNRNNLDNMETQK